jgi:hypothetical protein
MVALILSLGFGPAGIAAGVSKSNMLNLRWLTTFLGSLAAAFQGWMYGGFTPAAGVVATLTSMATLGVLQPFVVLFSAFSATVVALVVWACGVGRGAL